MKVAWPVEIAGTGHYVPPKVVTNDDFAQRLDTSHEWIIQRTGICERRLGEPEDSTLTFALAASREALANANLTPADLDYIVCGTATPDHPLPSTACELQAALGCGWIPAFDLSAACSGFVWSFITAAQLLVTGLANNVLLVGAEKLSAITDMEDRATAILFGDGAGAAILRKSTDPARGILAVRQGADGARGSLISVPAGGSKLPASAQTVAERLHYMRMQGREVYRFAVTQMQEVIARTAADAGVDLADVALLIPHQSNLRIIESACDKCNFPLDRVIININKYGNTSAASIGLALHEAWQTGRAKPGDLVMLVAFGAGLTWGSVLLRV